MTADPWFLDQRTKSAFFHQKPHEWKLLSVAEAIAGAKDLRLEPPRKPCRPLKPEEEEKRKVNQLRKISPGKGALGRRFSQEICRSAEQVDLQSELPWSLGR